MAKGIDTSASAVATNALRALPFGQIIGAPLKACIDAQTEAALSTWNYINSVGITKDENTGESKAVYVKFSYRSNGRYCSLSVPLLTLVPIPYLAIKNINIAFKADIAASSSTAETNSSSLEVEAGMKAKAGFNIGLASASVEMSAKVSSKKDSTSTRDSKYSVEYTMDVAVTAGQDDMPAGMSKVLELLNNSIETIENDGELMVNATEVTLADGKATIFVTYKDQEGIFSPKKISVNKGATIEIRGTGALISFSNAGEYEISISDNTKIPTVKIKVNAQP